MNNTTGNISPVRFWCQKILPAVFDDSLSYYELICKLVEKINEIIKQVNSFDLQYLQDEIDKLNEEFEKFKESGFDDYYAAQIEKWINDNLLTLWKAFVKQVFFGLTSDGYFCAYVPDSWSDITFDTGAIYSTPSYGRLILRFDADGCGVIDNTEGALTNDENIANLYLQVDKLNKNNFTALQSNEV